MKADFSKAKKSVHLLLCMIMVLVPVQSVWAEGPASASTQYCDNGGRFGGSPDALFQAEVAAAGTVGCDGGNTLSYYYVFNKSQYQSGGQSEDQCKIPGGGGRNAVTIPGDVVFVDVWHTACGSVHPAAPTGYSWRAYPIGQACPSGSSSGSDSQCRCTGFQKPDGKGGCEPYSLQNSPAPLGHCYAQTKAGDPIYPLNGSAAEEMALDIGAKGIDDRLYFDTSLAAGLFNQAQYAGVGEDFRGITGHSLGGMWSLLTDKQLLSMAGGNALLVFNGAGRVVHLARISASTFVSADGAQIVTQFSSGYYFYDFSNNIIESYDMAGKLQNISKASGGQIAITYSSSATPPAIAPAPDYAIAMTDTFGRSVALTYQTLASGKNRLVSESGPTEGVNFLYDTNDNLKTIAWAQSAVAKNFQYDSTNTWALTNFVDESNVAWHSFGYDSSGRAVSTQLAGGVESYSASYADGSGGIDAPYPQAIDTEPAAGSNLAMREFRWHNPASLNITKPNGSTSTVAPTTAGSFPAQGSLSQPAGAGCAATASSNTFDAFGNLASRDDFNGIRSCYAYDTARGLQTMALEGRANGNACSFVPSTADISHPERLTTTVWHPDWALKAQVAEPKKRTTWVYNGQTDSIAGTTASCVSPATTLPDGKPLAVLCARYEQATTDATGALGLSATAMGATRAWTYTYNQYGQMLTEITPKQSPTDTLSHTTTYGYYASTSFAGAVGHTVGDLSTITNPLGQVTTFISYDKAGRVLSTKDANSTVTSMTYWPRGWVHTQTVTPASGTALTTTYDYWPTGLLKLVTMPDASALNYGYDAAHRLTDITDAAGNKIHYVLDNVGNRTGEQVSDASGQLASTVSRVFDALNRVQTSTGAMH